MDALVVGLIAKAVKTGILGVLLIILIVQLVITKNKVLRDAKMLYSVIVLLGFGLNLM